MINDFDISSNPLADGVDVTSPDGGETANQKVVTVKDALASALGQKFDSDETALKAVKDTFSYVGKMGKARQALDAVMASRGVDEAGALKIMEDITTNAAPQTQQPAIDTDKFVSKQDLEDILFYKDNPSLVPVKEILDNVSKATGKSVREVAEMEQFKSLVTKAQAYDAQESTKSVLMTNPRLGQATDKMSEAREAASQGNTSTAEVKAIEAVLDFYDMK